MRKHTTMRVAGAAIAAVVLLATSASAFFTPRINHLTFNRSVALPGVVLPAGSYTFELAPPSGGLDVVRVSSRDGRRVFYWGFTQVVLRPAGMPQSATVTFGERAAGEPAPITAWYPVGSDKGHRFIYQ